MSSFRPRLVLIAVAVLALSIGTAARADNVRDVTPDPDAIFANFSESFAFGSANDLTVFTGRAGFRTTENRGNHWQRAMNGFLDEAGVEPFGNGLCQAPSAPSVLYAPAGQIPLTAESGLLPVFRSDDLGRSWHRRGSAGPLDVPVDCAVDASNADVLYLLAFDPFTGIVSFFRSTDGALSWTMAGGGLSQFGPAFVRTSATEAGVVYVTSPTGDAIDGIYRSADFGDTFTRMPASPSLPLRMAVDPRGRGLFVITADGRVFRSTDDGATFSALAPLASTNGVAFGSIAFAPADPSTLYITSSDGALLRSADFGDTFTPVAGTATLPANTEVRTVGVSPAHGGRGHLFVGTSRGPFRSDDDGQSFLSIIDSFRAATVNDLALDADGRLMVATFHTQAVFRARKAGHPRLYDAFGETLTITQPNAIGEWDAAAIAVSPTDAGRAVVVTNANGVFTTSDGGATWTRATLVPNVTSFGSSVRAAFAPGTDATSRNRVYVVRTGSLFRSNDGGLAFNRLQRGLFGSIAVDPGNADVLYLGTLLGGQGLFKSTNGGVTVTRLGVPGDFRSISIDPRNPLTVYAANAAGGVLKSLDGGASWANSSSGLPAGETLTVAADPVIAGRVYAWIRAAGLFASADDGATWTAADTGESARRSGIEAGRAAMTVDRLVPGRVYLGNSGVLQIDTLSDGD